MTGGDLWTLYRTGLAVLTEGSLSGAGRLLGLSQPTVGRQVEALEAQLGRGRLFTRSQRGLLPTETMLAMRPHLETMASAAAAAARAGSGGSEELAGVVRITASEIVGGEVLPGLLASLRSAHRGLVFELSLSNRTEDMLRRDADIAVRMVQPAQKALVSRHIGKVALDLYAHESYARQYGLPQSVADLAGHALIGFDRATPFLNAAAQGLALDRNLFALRLDNDLAALAAVRAGFGIGPVQRPIAARDPALVKVLPGAVAFELEFWVVMHEDLKRTRRMRAVYDGLVEGLTRHVGQGKRG
ncbi:MAG: LysR family transcriptional regulator [Alphaproteobacteria bacterium]|nr:LysR family transcriptional regulator [Alphaproteobacteria bacterium]